MSLFSGPEDHAANPPQSWQVIPYGGRRWALLAAGAVLGTFERKSEAERHRLEGFYVNLYEQEARWYGGEPVPGWHPYAELVR